MDEGSFDEASGEAGHFFHLEVHLARNHGEEGVVAGAGDSLTRMELRATLAKNDIAGFRLLIAEDLDAETLGNRVTAKVGRTAGFSVCHSFRYYVFITCTVY